MLEISCLVWVRYCSSAWATAVDTLGPTPPRPAAAPDLPLDHELAAESDTRKEAYIAAMDSMIKACPACGIVRKCTLESSEYLLPAPWRGQVCCDFDRPKGPFTRTR